MASYREELRKLLRLRCSIEKARQVAYRMPPAKAKMLRDRMRAKRWR